MFDICHWINEPETWLAEPARLRVITDRHSDFWRLTHDGAERDSGHFFGARVHSGFTAQLRVAARCKNQGDHAGIMVESMSTTGCAPASAISTTPRNCSAY